MLRTAKWWRRELERQQRAWEAERQDLIRTVCHLAGKPMPSVREIPVRDREPAVRTWTPSPEQQPLQ